jgi:hypothetical protein
MAASCSKISGSQASAANLCASVALERKRLPVIVRSIRVSSGNYRSIPPADQSQLNSA